MGPFKLLFTAPAHASLLTLAQNPGLVRRLKAVQKTLALLETNPKHPSLNTHKYSSLLGPNGEPVFEAYAENKTPAAFRVFFCYGPNKDDITIIAITPHP